MSTNGERDDGDTVEALDMFHLFVELKEIDKYERDVLYPLATKQIAIDLDDGVKVNYLKFGSALKKVPGLEEKEELL